ncbi:hypothetical protein OC834_004650 [Tilletia horrida]|nr:hypothetical protein OC834_004650 [Tilletia horrida]
MRATSHSLLVRLCLVASLLLLAFSASAAAAGAADTASKSGARAPAAASTKDGTKPAAAGKPNRKLPVMTAERLRLFNGTDASLPLLVALDRRVYDVSTKRDVYGPGGGYETFSGRDSTRNFALYSTESKDDGSCIDDLEEKDFKMLAEWRRWFDERYPLVAVITEKLCESDDSPEDAARRGFAIPSTASSQQQQEEKGQQKPLSMPSQQDQQRKQRPPSPSTEL